MFNEKEMFIGIGIFIIIGSLFSVYFVLGDSNSTINNKLDVENIDTDSKFSSITGNVIGLFNRNEIKETNNLVNENYCGDGYCYIDSNEDYENCNTCPQDCGSCGESNSCGDNVCSVGECTTCFSDCSYLECQNGICEADNGETCSNSPNDCGCIGDYYCSEGICVDSKEGINDITSDWNYPLVFVHGHSADELGSRYSISTFNEFQDKLASDGLYIEREPIIASNNKYDFIKNQWANSQLPPSIRTTYYLGEYSRNSEFIYDDNNQNIEEYAKRLGKIVDLVRYTTGRDKVDIVAHSMGGLVSREYIRQTEGKYVNKLVMIGTPNAGVYDYIDTFCEGGFGRTQYSPECKDMQNDSPFLIRLNKGDLDYRDKYLTISGNAKEVDWNDQFKRSLCPDNKSPHDEVVCSLSVSLSGSKNDYVIGDQIAGWGNTFHADLVSPSKVNEVYKKSVEFLR